ncbi:Pectin lyase-like superfamily protein [Euphorbia peplus]|nr:Pectin lyase-like superfamily protein [Euphorbia peplus]
MGHKIGLIIFTFIVTCINVIICDDSVPVPAEKTAVNAWFQQNLKSTKLNPILQQAERVRKVIKVGPNGQFKTISQAIASVPSGNKGRVIIQIAKGVYNEKIKVERTKPFITFYGKPGTIVQASGNAAQYGTLNSASVIVEADYFIAYNIIFKNTSPRPTPADTKKGSAGAQAVALRISGDMAAFYGCKFYGFQDTLCDDKGRHLFMNCFIEGTVDFIFGSGKSLYLLTTLHVLKESWKTVITAQAKKEANEDSGYSFVHCAINGDGVQEANLGRGWFQRPSVVFSYSTMNNGINPIAWEANKQPAATLNFGEYQNKGAGANLNGRAAFTKKLDFAAAKPYVTLGFIEASTWLLQPASA